MMRRVRDKYIKAHGLPPDSPPPPRLPNVFQNYRRYVQSVCFSADGGTLATATAAYGVIFWDFKTGKQRLFYRANDDYPCDGSMALAPDGRSFAIADTYVRQVHFIEAATWQPRATVRAPWWPASYNQVYTAAWAVAPHRPLGAAHRAPTSISRRCSEVTPRSNAVPRKSSTRVGSWALRTPSC